MLSLMASRRFAPLFWCQFFAAFNDNFLKTALVFLILFGGHPQAEALITLAGAVFIAPFFFLSALGGEIADRHDKARVARRRWSGRMPYLIGPNSEASTPKPNKAANSTGSDSRT